MMISETIKYVNSDFDVDTSKKRIVADSFIAPKRQQQKKSFQICVTMTIECEPVHDENRNLQMANQYALMPCKQNANTDAICRY